MKSVIKRLLPKPLWDGLRTSKHAVLKVMRRGLESLGLVVALKSDYHSPLPSEFELERSLARWNKPSPLRGLRYDLDANRRRLSTLMSKYYDEFAQLPSHESLVRLRYGHGFPSVDALVLYAMIRDLKPKRYLEVGSGMSTYYCSLACRRNASEGRETAITCVEPFPFKSLGEIEGIRIINALVQDVSLDDFRELEAGDVLFIDSSHILRLDGDVPFLYLEVLPLLKQGVHVHIHDIPFPYNCPHPAEYWVLTQGRTANHWPVYWNEPMVLQAFLAFNPDFEIELSCPLVRHFDEPFLRNTVPTYRSTAEESDTFSSIWLVRSQVSR